MKKTFSTLCSVAFVAIFVLACSGVDEEKLGSHQESLTKQCSYKCGAFYAKTCYCTGVCVDKATVKCQAPAQSDTIETVDPMDYGTCTYALDTDATSCTSAAGYNLVSCKYQKNPTNNCKNNGVCPAVDNGLQCKDCPDRLDSTTCPHD